MNFWYMEVGTVHLKDEFGWYIGNVENMKKDEKRSKKIKKDELCGTLQNQNINLVVHGKWDWSILLISKHEKDEFGGT